MKILIFSWRDIKHPKTGGAEVLTMELATRWIKKGHQVSIISARFPGAKGQESIKKVHVYRPAQFYQYSPISYLLFLIKAARFYRKNMASKYDIIIDQVHGLPLFTPFYVKEKVVIFPLEVAQDIWRYEIPFPFWIFGWLLEFAYIKLFRNHQFLAISKSTVKDLKRLGVKKVNIITPGISFKPQVKVPKKSRYPLIVSLSRLTPMKRIEETLDGFKLVLKQFPQARLLIIGKGEGKYVKKLKKKAKELGLTNQATFTNYVSEKEKQKLLSEAWVLVSTSLREGFGLNVIEAAACGTPSVVYDVPGLVNSVKNKKTGLICSKNSPEELIRNLAKLLSDKRLRLKLAKNALEHSQSFNWNKAARQALEVL
jgi:glycosyltransferase involved in cell wall biosynthesis